MNSYNLQLPILMPGINRTSQMATYKRAHGRDAGAVSVEAAMVSTAALGPWIARYLARSRAGIFGHPTELFISSTIVSMGIVAASASLHVFAGFCIFFDVFEGFCMFLDVFGWISKVF